MVVGCLTAQQHAVDVGCSMSQQHAVDVGCSMSQQHAVDVGYLLNVPATRTCCLFVA